MNEAQRYIVLVLAWWFFYPWYGGSVVGPFQTQDQCEQIRAQVTTKTTVCWSDGK